MQASQTAEKEPPTSHQEDISSTAAASDSSASKASPIDIQEYNPDNDPFDNTLTAESLCSVVSDPVDFMSNASQSIAGSASAQLKRDLDAKIALLRAANGHVLVLH